MLSRLYFCDPAGIRTQDPYIKSVMLYQLSYGILNLLCMQPHIDFGSANIEALFYFAKAFL
ncbi:MAG: hypothetical protein JWO09_2819 [Bacteroidetes bacterium]|nr:hypothetical protein [Bacteroidota bacterium]